MARRIPTRSLISSVDPRPPRYSYSNEDDSSRYIALCLKCKLSTQGGRPQIAKSLSKSKGGSQITILSLNACEQVFEMRRRWQVFLASQCLRVSIMSPIKRSVEDRT